MQRISIPIDGMTCGGCVRTVRDALAGLPGVQVERVEVGSAVVTLDPALTTPDKVRVAITQSGYEARSPIAVE